MYVVKFVSKGTKDIIIIKNGARRFFSDCKYYRRLENNALELYLNAIISASKCTPRFVEQSLTLCHTCHCEWMWSLPAEPLKRFSVFELGPKKKGPDREHIRKKEHYITRA